MEIMDWINVKKKTPINNQNVLIAVDGETYPEIVYYHEESNKFLYEGYPLLDWEDYERNITHWMALPKSPLIL